MSDRGEGAPASRTSSSPKGMRKTVLALSALLPLAAGPSPPAPDTLNLRGQPQRLLLYGSRGAPAAVVASGDGGWIHLAPHVAELLAGHGYFVVGLDSKAYLSSFTRGSTSLGTADVPVDFGTLADYAARGAGSRPVLVGVSEGAALAVLAAASDALKSKVAGVVALGLPDRAELGWRFRDSVIYLTKGVPREPLFSTAEVIGGVSPLPVAAIHSTRDEFVGVDEVKRVMGRALEPKRLWLIEAADHRFGGKEAELDRKLLEAIAWVKEQPR